MCTSPAACTGTATRPTSRPSPTGLITAVELTAGDVSDAGAAPALIADEPAGTEVYGDSAYGTAELRAHLAERDMGAVIKPPPIQTAVPGGYSVDDFDIDLDTGTVTCPEAITVAISPNRTARFARNCRSCPVRARCTTAKAGRSIKIHPRHELLNPAREQARTDLFSSRYNRWRPMAERSIAWIVRKNRRCPYRGTERNQLWLTTRAAAVNLQRLINLGLTHNDNHWAIT